MCVCMVHEYVRMCVRAWWTSMYVCVHGTRVCTYVCACMVDEYVCVCTHGGQVCMYVCMYVCVCMVDVRMHVCACMWITAQCLNG